MKTNSEYFMNDGYDNHLYLVAYSLFAVINYIAILYIYEISLISISFRLFLFLICVFGSLS